MKDIYKIVREVENYDILLSNLTQKTVKEDTRLPDSEWKELDELEKKIRKMCNDVTPNP